MRSSNLTTLHPRPYRYWYGPLPYRYGTETAWRLGNLTMQQCSMFSQKWTYVMVLSYAIFRGYIEIGSQHRYSRCRRCLACSEQCNWFVAQNNCQDALIGEHTPMHLSYLIHLPKKTLKWTIARLGNQSESFLGWNFHRFAYARQNLHERKCKVLASTQYQTHTFLNVTFTNFRFMYDHIQSI